MRKVRVLFEVGHHSRPSAVQAYFHLTPCGVSSSRWHLVLRFLLFPEYYGGKTHSDCASLSFQKYNYVYLHYSFPCCPDVAIFLWFAVSVVNSSFINTTCESVLFREFHTSSTKKAPFPVPMSRMAAFSGISALSIHRSTRLMLSSPNLTTRRNPQTSVTRWVIKIKTNNKLEMSWASPLALCEASG